MIGVRAFADRVAPPAPPAGVSCLDCLVWTEDDACA